MGCKINRNLEGKAVSVNLKSDFTDNLIEQLRFVQSLNESQVAGTVNIVNRILSNIAKRTGKSLEELKTSIELRTVPDVSGLLEEVESNPQQSIAYLAGLNPNAIVNNFQDSEVEILNQTYSEENKKYTNNNGLNLFDNLDKFIELGKKNPSYFTYPTNCSKTSRANVPCKML